MLIGDFSQRREMNTSREPDRPPVDLEAASCESDVRSGNVTLSSRLGPLHFAPAQAESLAIELLTCAEGPAGLSYRLIVRDAGDDAPIATEAEVEAAETLLRAHIPDLGERLAIVGELLQLLSF